MVFVPNRKKNYAGMDGGDFSKKLNVTSLMVFFSGMGQHLDSKAESLITRILNREKKKQSDPFLKYI